MSEVTIFFGIGFGDGKTTQAFNYLIQNNETEFKLSDKIVITDDIYTFSGSRIINIAEIVGCDALCKEKVTAGYLECLGDQYKEVYFDTCSKSKYYYYSDMIEELSKTNTVNLIFVIDILRLLNLDEEQEFSEYKAVILTKCDYLNIYNKDVIEKAEELVQQIPLSTEVYISKGTTIPNSLIKIKDEARCIKQKITLKEFLK